MKSIQFSIFSGSFWKKFFLRLLLTTGFLGVFMSTLYAYIPNAGTIYENWLQEIFVELPSGTDGLQTELQNLTVQRANALVDEDGNAVAKGVIGTGAEGEVLIGDTSSISGDLLKVSGVDTKDAAVQITAISGNPEVSLGDTNGLHGSVYKDTSSGELRVWTGDSGVSPTGQDAIEIKNDRINFTTSLRARGNLVVTAFKCTAGSGFLVGFDDDANPICSNDTDTTSWIAVPNAPGVCSARCGGGTMEYTVSCRDANYAVVADSVCEGLDLEKPSESRVCNDFVCE